MTIFKKSICLKSQGESYGKEQFSKITYHFLTFRVVGSYYISYSLLTVYKSKYYLKLLHSLQNMSLGFFDGTILLEQHSCPVLKCISLWADFCVESETAYSTVGNLIPRSRKMPLQCSSIQELAPECEGYSMEALQYENQCGLNTAPNYVFSQGILLASTEQLLGAQSKTFSAPAAKEVTSKVQTYLQKGSIGNKTLSTRISEIFGVMKDARLPNPLLPKFMLLLVFNNRTLSKFNNFLSEVFHRFPWEKFVSETNLEQLSVKITTFM